MKKMYSLVLGIFFCLVFAPNNLNAAVELVSFDVIPSGSHVQIHWSTSSELNADFFQIQNSRDDLVWWDVSTADAVGNSSSIVNYSFLHTEAFPGPSFYRLVEFDTAGNSTVLSSAGTSLISTDNMEVYPNPANTEIFIEAEGNISSLDITLTDLAGNPVFVDAQNYGNRTVVNTTDLKNGVYLLRSQFGKSITSKRVVISHNR